MTSGALARLRQDHRARVLAAVASGAAATRVHVARDTGLSLSTVGSLVAELLTEGRLVESGLGPSTARGGRPAGRLAVAPAAAVDTRVAGVHLGHDNVRVALATVGGEVLGEEHRDSDVDSHPEATLSYAAGALTALLRSAGCDPADVARVGVAVSAPVYSSSQRLRIPSMMRAWDGVDVGERLRELTGFPVVVGNDANLGALAEQRFGAGRGVRDLIYVMLSDGVGAGLVLEGRLYEGANGLSGELGHVTLADDGQLCRCGNRGCLETLAGTRAITDALDRTAGPGTTLADVLDLVADGDPGATRVVADAGRAVGQALAGLCTVLDPRMVVVGGKLAAAGETLCSGIRDVLARTLPPVTNQSLAIALGELGDRAEVLGAVAAAASDWEGTVARQR